jgi:hypothetical protein
MGSEMWESTEVGIGLELRLEELVKVEWNTFNKKGDLCRFWWWMWILEK